MSPTRSIAIARTTARLVIKDPSVTIIMIVMPLIFVGFLKPSLEAQLQQQGYAGVSGAQAGVPGLAVMFAFLSIQTVCMIFFREHFWGTWQRVRAAGATGGELVIGKAGPLVIVILAQMAVVFAASAWLFDYRVTGSMLALGLLLTGIALSVVSMGVLVVALLKTLDQAMVVGNMSGMVMAGFGGALAPTSTLPAWAQSIAQVTPTYWGIEGLREVGLDGAQVADILPALGVMGVFTATCVAIAAMRFQPTDTKVGST
ncbi:ABC transporter permease [Demequina sp.]|uniref:ABC transporter permease n=1 Tax=Demequina sp. TaxID=2050685 RepID=UPI0025BCF508|nr:ABC transporter permease [Demequina sp.]